jgi:hypothetical protein
MLRIENFHATVDDKAILEWISLDREGARRARWRMTMRGTVALLAGIAAAGTANAQAATPALDRLDDCIRQSIERSAAYRGAANEPAISRLAKSALAECDALVDPAIGDYSALVIAAQRSSDPALLRRSMAALPVVWRPMVVSTRLSMARAHVGIVAGRHDPAFPEESGRSAR